MCSSSNTLNIPICAKRFNYITIQVNAKLFIHSYKYKTVSNPSRITMYCIYGCARIIETFTKYKHQFTCRINASARVRHYIISVMRTASYLLMHREILYHQQSDKKITITLWKWSLARKLCWKSDCQVDSVEPYIFVAAR